MSLEEFSKKRFLIVDSLDSFSFSTKKTLKSLGLSLVDTASTAQKVINGFKNVDYDVILCNYDLGKGKNGQELLEELRYRKLLKYTGLFFIISAEVEKDKVMGTIENEPDGYLVKPITPLELKTRLSKALKQKDATLQIDTAIDDEDYRLAVSYCDEKISANDSYLSLCMKTKGWLLNKIDDLDEAEEVYNRALKTKDFIWAEYGLAKIAIKRENYDKAETLLKTIIAKDSHQIEALDLLAEIYKKCNRPNEAYDLIKKATGLSPNVLERQQELAELCITRGKSEEAIDAFRNVIKLGENSVHAEPNQYFDFANFLAVSATNEESPNDSVQLKEAFELINKGRKRFSEKDQIQVQTEIMTASLNAIVGNDREAKALYDSLTDQDGEEATWDAKTCQIAAQTLSLLDRQDDAEKMLERAADISGNDADQISRVYDQLNQSITAETRARAAQMNKEGIKYYSSGDIEKAAKELRLAIPLTPRHISLNLNLVQVLLKLGKSNQDEDFASEVESHLHKIRHIPKHHKEYKRYLHLLKQTQEHDD